jgi:hypothetical protein
MYLQTYFVLTGEGVVAGKPLERSDWPRRTGMSRVTEVVFNLNQGYNRGTACCNLSKKKLLFVLF